MPWRSSLAQHISLIVWRVSSSLRSVKSLVHTLLVEKEPSALPGAFQIPLRTWVHWHGLFQLLVICFGHWGGISFNTSKLNILPKEKQQTLLFFTHLVSSLPPIDSDSWILSVKNKLKGIPWWSSGYYLGPSLPWAWVQFLVEKLRFHKLYGPPKKNKLKKRK